MNDFENCRGCGKERICDENELCPQCVRGNGRHMTTPAEARAYLNAHRPPALDWNAPRTERRSADDRDPFRHTSGNDQFLTPGAPASGKQIPRHRWPEQVSPERAGLQPSSVDSNVYESWQRDQRLMLDMAIHTAERQHAEHKATFSELARQAPERADSAASAPNPIPANSQAEEEQRAAEAGRKLSALGYILRIGATNSYVRDSGGNVVGEYAYVVCRVSGEYMSTELIGNLLAVESFAWSAEREAREKAEALRRLTETPAKPLIHVGEVIAVPFGEDFPSESELARRRMRAELKQELLEELKGDA